MRREAEPYPMHHMKVPEDKVERLEDIDRIWGECVTCGDITVLVAPAGICGVCAFGKPIPQDGNI